MKSMTGYGSGEYADEKLHITLDIKSCNNRYFDVIFNIPHNINSLEPRLRKYISSKIKRGKVEVNLNITEFEEDQAVYLDDNAASAYLKALSHLKEITGIQESIRLNHLIRMEGIVKTEKNRNTESLWPKISELLENAFREFEQSRIVEGENTKRDIVKLLQQVGEELNKIEELAPILEEKIKTNIRARFDEVLDGKIDESRLLTETALLLIKFDINEEIVRMKSHMKSFELAMENTSELGKKLDFICQELNREANTIGAKNTLVDADNSVIAIKYALEKIREQLRNVE